MKYRTDRTWVVAARWAGAAAMSLACVVAGAAGRTYTLDADFDLGVLVGLNHNPPNNNQLQISTVTTTFPVMWIANGGEDTVSKIDTRTGREIGRYRTWFGPSGQPGYFNHLGDPFAGPAPSRTAVDSQGNAYVANRWFSASRQAWVIKILAEGGIDRNGNGVIDTSFDANNDGTISPSEMKPMADNFGGSANNLIDPQEIQDERIAWAVPVGPANGLGRALCIGRDGNLWVGLFNARQFWKISSVDGSVLAGPVSATPSANQPNAGSWTPYGCLVDRNGTLWSASLSGVLGKITNTDLNPTAAVPNPYVVSSFAHSGSNYGIALGNERVFLGLTSGSSYTEFNPATNTFIFPAALSFASTGISVDVDGNIVTGSYASGGVTKFRWSAVAAQNGQVIWNRPTQLAAETRGVIVDAANDVWQVSRNGNVVMKYRSDGVPQGVFPVGNQPYTYSDATGLTQRSENPSGTWTVVFDGGVASLPWGTINWTDLVPPGASVLVQARTANSEAALGSATFQPITRNVAFSATGRYIEIRTQLNASPDRQSPILYDLTVNSISTTCDVDGDGDVDSADIALIRAGIGQTPTAGDPRDANGDGAITINDARTCTQRCTRAACATQ